MKPTTLNHLLKILPIWENINVRSRDDETRPVVRALLAGDTLYFEEFIKAGADIIFTLDNGETIFHIIAKRGLIQHLRCLRKYTAKLPHIETRRHCDQLTALQAAYICDQKTVFNILRNEFKADNGARFGNSAHYNTKDVCFLMNEVKNGSESLTSATQCGECPMQFINGFDDCDNIDMNRWNKEQWPAAKALSLVVDDNVIQSPNQQQCTGKWIPSYCDTKDEVIIPSPNIGMKIGEVKLFTLTDLPDRYLYPESVKDLLFVTEEENCDGV